MLVGARWLEVKDMVDGHAAMGGRGTYRWATVALLPFNAMAVISSDVTSGCLR
jgi:hypothetical protein